MSLLDLIIVVLVLAAIARGLVQGAVMQLLPFGGFWLGILLGAALAPAIAGFADTRSGKTFLTLITVFGVAFLLSGAGRQVGVVIWRAVRKARLGIADVALGAAISGVATLLAIWLLASIFSGLPSSGVSRAIHDSAIVRTLDRALPPAPSVFSRIRQLIDASGFPDVFAGLEPGVGEPVDLPGDPEVRAALEAAGRSTVRIAGVGCGGIKTGSGFVVAPGIVVTNAHVVSGIDRPVVEDRNGNHPATPVHFDPDLDVAILRAGRLAGSPLPLSGDRVPRGTGSAVLGYPGGGALRAGPAAVLDEFNAVGRDIYGRRLTTRNVYQLQAEVRQGNSGGPFVRTNGEVLGVIFSASVTNQEVGYAITSTEVTPLVEGARDRQDAVDTGPCT